MKRLSWLISKYLIQAILPYFIFSWLLLSVILFVQQASRYSDIFFSLNIPKSLVWQLTFALVPNVTAFTCPMAVLVGVVIGLSRMQGDNELIAIRSTGAGNFQITVPVVFLGVTLSIFTLLINLYGVPFAARIVRQVALQTALYKLESPIEPGVFNTEVNGYTIYVKDGDFEKGTWKNIFIYNEDKLNSQVRLITSKSGRIDTHEDVSELVLENAVVNTFSTPTLTGRAKYAAENVGQIRFAIKTKRGEIIEKLSQTEQTPEELGLIELARYAANKEGKERTEAQILWQRRIILSVTPLIFALLGTALVLRFNRGGRGFGILLALISLVFYYLIALFGEQMARTGSISVVGAGALPLSVSAAVICWFFLSNRLLLRNVFGGFGKRLKIESPWKSKTTSGKNFYTALTTRILDFDIVLNLLVYFVETLFFLASIYMIFTAFELWKFAGEIDGGLTLLLKYLVFLLPFIYIQLAPSALMIATLATFVIKSRQNEIVSWTAAGQSVYRLLMPCFVLMIFVGAVNLGIQELVAPTTNKIQDELRGQIRSRGIKANSDGKFWVANDRRIYSFEMDGAGTVGNQPVKNLAIYEFSDDQTKIQTVYRIPRAVWEKKAIVFSGAAEKQSWADGKVTVSRDTGGMLNEAVNPIGGLDDKPSHLGLEELQEQIKNTASDSERRSFETAYEKKYATLFLPFVITLFTAPFALSLSRKGRVVTVGYAVGVWLLFIGITSTFEQFGSNGYISPGFAVWSPLFLFSIIGAYLLSKVRT